MLVSCLTGVNNKIQKVFVTFENSIDFNVYFHVYNATDDLIPKNRRCRNQHSLAFQIPSARKEAYKSSSFPQTIRDWNDLPDSLISSAEMSDDCVSKVRYTRAFKGLISPPSEPPGEIMSFGVSPLNYSDSDQTRKIILPLLVNIFLSFWCHLTVLKVK